MFTEGRRSRNLRRYWLSIVVFITWFIGVGTLALRAQDQEGALSSIGVPTYTTTLPVEKGYIKLSNGALHLEIPIVSSPQRNGREFKATLVYDSNIWGGGVLPANIPSTNTVASLAIDSPSIGGWRLITSADAGAVDFVESDVNTCSHQGVVEQGKAVYTKFFWTAPDGTTHGFDMRTVQGIPTDCNDGSQYDQPLGSSFALDASGYSISSDANWNLTVRSPDGTIVYQDGSTQRPKDSNGNFYTSTLHQSGFGASGFPRYGGYFTSSGAVTDSLGRTLLTASLSGTTVYFDVLNSKGTTSRYTITTAQIPLYAEFSTTPPNYYTFSGNSITGIQSVQLPDGTSYTFTYDCPTTSGTACSGNSSGSYNYGELTSMTLPTGGKVQYSYSNYNQAGGPHTGQFYGRMLATRITPDGPNPWTYATQWNAAWWNGTPNPLLQTFTATKPSSDTDVYTLTYNGGLWPTMAQYYSGGVSSSNLLATITQVFNFSTQCPGGSIMACSNCGNAACAINVTKTSESTTLPIPGSSSVTQTSQFTWDSESQSGETNVSLYGNVIQKQEWNFGSPLSNPADRTTTFTYLNGSSYITANILDRPASITVANSSGATVAQTTNCYDYIGGCGGSAFGSAGTITNHDTNYGTSYTVRGDLTQTQKLVSGSTFLTQSMTYDTAGQLLSKTDWTNINSTTYSYADQYYIDAGNGSNPSTYSAGTATDGYPTTITYPTVNSVTLMDKFGYYYGTGQKAISTDANVQTSYFHFYDPLNRPTSSKLPNLYNGNCCGWTYNVYPNASETKVDSGIGITSTTLSASCSPSAGDCRHDQKLLDGLGRISSQILVSDPDCSSGTIVLTTYDPNGRVFSISNPYCTSSDPTYGTETYAYDGLDRKTATTLADGSVYNIYYGPTVVSHGGLSSMSCTGYGFPTEYQDETGFLRQAWTDGFGRLVEVDEPNTSNILSSGVHTCYTYDLNNNLTGVSNASQTRTFYYDMLSRLTEAINPESSTICYYYTTSGESCGVPSSGTLCSGDPSEVCRRTDARGITTTYAYDALHRLTSKTYSDPFTVPSYYYYDQSAPWGYSLSNPFGRLTTMGTYNGSAWLTASAFSYDPLGNVVVKQERVDVSSFVYNNLYYAYNLDSSIASVIYPSSRIITYAPGGAQRPLSAKDVTNSVNYATGATYASPGGIASVNIGANLVSNLFYNKRLQPCRTSVKNTGTPPSSCADNSHTGNVMDLTYNFHVGSSDNGNVWGITNNTDTTRSQTFAYDALNRISTAQTTSNFGTSATNCWSEIYNIDTLGNLTSVTAPSGTYPTNPYGGCVQESGFSTTVNTHNQDALSCFDASGNKVGAYAGSCSPLPTSYSYDAENRLTSAGGVTYYYDANSKRVEKNNGTIYWYGTSPDPLVETDLSDTLRYEYIFFNGKRTARRDASGNVDYYIGDQLGTARVVTNASGTIQDAVDYYPYGGERDVTGPASGNTYKFTGKERDAESGLDNFGARYMSSQYGRFMTPDWSANASAVPFADFSDPQSLNLYSYVRNNPLNRTDPSGHCDADGEHHGFWWCVGHAIGATETRKEYNNRIDTERQWLTTNARNPDGTGLSPSQRSALGGASSGQVDSLYQGYARTLALNSIFGFNMSDEATSTDPKDWGRDASGALVPLIRLHGDAMIGNSARYDFWKGKSTEEIIESLKEGSKWGELTVRPNGLVLDGNTRIKILEERGIDVNALERVIIEPKP